MNEQLDLFTEYSDDYYNEVLEKLDTKEILQIEIDSTLEEAITEMTELQKEYDSIQTEKLVDLCKANVMNTITSQFGLASLFIEAKDGGNVTTTHNFEKGITATDKDAQSYQNYEHVNHGGFNEKRALYDKKKDEIRANDKANGVISVKDEYTGKTISIKRADIDHVVSAKEIESNSKNNLFLSQDERVKLGTDDVNLAYTKDKANRSKGAKSMEDWLDKERPEGITNEEAFGIDRDKAIARDKASRDNINRTVNKAAFKKYSKELLATGAKDAASMAAYSAFGVIIHDFALAVVEELKYILKNKGKKSFKELFAHFKEKMASVLNEIKAKWKDIFKGSLEAGITAFLSNIVVFVINLFATTLKKIVSMIRAGFVSLCQAIKIMATRPNGITQEEANFEATKVLTAGIIGALSLGLSACIEKFLQSIPGLQPIMMFPIPSLGREQRTVSDVIAVTLSAIAGGLVSTIVLYFMDKSRNEAKKDKLQIQMVTTSGVIVNCNVAKTWCVLDDAYRFFEKEFYQAKIMLEETSKRIEDSFNATERANDERNKVMEQLRLLNL